MSWQTGNRRKSVGLIGGVVAAGLLGGYGILNQNQSAPVLRLSGEGVPTARTIMVDLRGAVARPAVYKLPEGSRLQDLLKAAGGCTREADQSQLNLADPLVDGCRVTIPDLTGSNSEPIIQMPHLAQKTVSRSKTSGVRRESGPKQAPAPGSININMASAAELEELPGIGPAMAQRIITARGQLGGFRTIEQLLDVKGIGEKTLAKLRPYIRL